MANDEELDPVEQVFLHAYPNPNRIGCPGSDVIRAIAKNTLPLDHPAREHLAKCSPCYAEFKQFRRQIAKRAARLRLVGGMAALVAVAVLSWALLVRNREQARTPDHQLRTAAPAGAERQPPPENPA